MYYIRFLKSPRLSSSAQLIWTAKITITTDLGEAFLFQDIAIIAELELGDGTTLSGKEYRWKGRDGMRGLEVSASLPQSRSRTLGKVRMLVHPKEDENAATSFEKILRCSNQWTGIVAVRSPLMQISSQQPPPSAGLAERILISETTGKEVHTWEETGESIARHIWDAGLMLSSYLACLSPKSSRPKTSSPSPPILQALYSTLSRPNLQILELGSGCGIASLTLSTHFASQISHLILTDLPEASDILTHNLSLLPRHSSVSSLTTPTITHQILDWSLPLLSNLAGKAFDLVFFADCTYNPDVVPDLVKTLEVLREGGEREMLVLCAMKVRHESENIFFELMDKKGFEIVEKMSLQAGIGDLEGTGEEIEVFVFR